MTQIKQIKLADLKKGTMLYIIASAMVKEHGVYMCKIDNQKVKVTA